MRCPLLLVVVVVGSGACREREAAPVAREADRIAVPTPTQPVPVASGAGRVRPALTPDEGRIAIDAPPPGKPGIESYARIAVIANPGYEITERAPAHLTLDPIPGVTLAGTRVEHDGDRELAFTVALVAERAGDYAIGGRVDFAVCKVGAQCRPKTMPVTLQVAAR